MSSGVSVTHLAPPLLSGPKNIAGSIAVQLSAGASAPRVRFIEATLRGPSFPARRLVGRTGKTAPATAHFRCRRLFLDGIRLADSNGTTILEGLPPSVPVHVFDEVLISRVTSRPLTLTEIQEKGIVIDEQNFHAVEFEVGFVVDGRRSREVSRGSADVRTIDGSHTGGGTRGAAEAGGGD
jgi:hypothetical protein